MIYAILGATNPFLNGCWMHLKGPLIKLSYDSAMKS